MNKLSLMDQLFYKAAQHEVASVIMGGASILAPAKRGGRLNAKRLAGHIASRLEQVPSMRKKFQQDPLRIGSVHKVDDPAFDISAHITVETLPAPGNYRQLTAALGDISTRSLRNGELWHWTLLGGLEGGKVALVCQMHHALFDGLGAMKALGSMYNSNPVALETPCHLPPASGETPSYALLGRAIAESSSRLCLKTPRFIASNALPLLGALAGGIRGAMEQGREGLSLPEMHSTSHNLSEASGTRSVAYKTLSLPEIKQFARDRGCTVNDLALLLYSFAMEHYFRETGETIDFDLYCGMPVSTRTEDSSSGNQVTVSRVNLHNTIDGVEARLRAIHADTTEGKKNRARSAQAIDTAALGELVSPLLLDGLMYLSNRAGLVGRVGGNLPVFNSLLSNVPGPVEKSYIGNAVLVESIPLIPAIDVIAVSAGITSVGDTITFGFHCDGGAIPDPELLVSGVMKGLATLRKDSRKSQAGKAPARRRTPAKKRISKK